MHFFRGKFKETSIFLHERAVATKITQEDVSEFLDKYKSYFDRLQTNFGSISSISGIEDELLKRFNDVISIFHDNIYKYPVSGPLASYPLEKLIATIELLDPTRINFEKLNISVDKAIEEIGSDITSSSTDIGALIEGLESLSKDFESKKQNIDEIEAIINAIFDTSNDPSDLDGLNALKESIESLIAKYKDENIADLARDITKIKDDFQDKSDKVEDFLQKISDEIGRLKDLKEKYNEREFSEFKREIGQKVELLNSKISELNDLKSKIESSFSPVKDVFVTIEEYHEKVTQLQESDSDHLEAFQERLDELTEKIDALRTQPDQSENEVEDVLAEKIRAIEGKKSEIGTILEEITELSNKLDDKKAEYLGIAMSITEENIEITLQKFGDLYKGDGGYSAILDELRTKFEELKVANTKYSELLGGLENEAFSELGQSQLNKKDSLIAFRDATNNEISNIKDKISEYEQFKDRLNKEIEELTLKLEDFKPVLDVREVIESYDTISADHISYSETTLGITVSDVETKTYEYTDSTFKRLFGKLRDGDTSSKLTASSEIAELWEKMDEDAKNKIFARYDVEADKSEDVREVIESYDTISADHISYSETTLGITVSDVETKTYEYTDSTFKRLFGKLRDGDTSSKLTASSEIAELWEKMDEDAKNKIFARYDVEADKSEDVREVIEPYDTISADHISYSETTLGITVSDVETKTYEYTDSTFKRLFGKLRDGDTSSKLTASSEIAELWEKMDEDAKNKIFARYDVEADKSEDVREVIESYDTISADHISYSETTLGITVSDVETKTYEYTDSTFKRLFGKLRDGDTSSKLTASSEIAELWEKMDEDAKNKIFARYDVEADKSEDVREVIESYDTISADHISYSETTLGITVSDVETKTYEYTDSTFKRLFGKLRDGDTSSKLTASSEIAELWEKMDEDAKNKIFARYGVEAERSEDQVDRSDQKSHLKLVFCSTTEIPKQIIPALKEKVDILVGTSNEDIMAMIYDELIAVTKEIAGKSSSKDSEIAETFKISIYDLREPLGSRIYDLKDDIYTPLTINDTDRIILIEENSKEGDDFMPDNFTTEIFDLTEPIEE